MRTNAPTPKQINYILDLIGERHEWAAFGEIAKDMQVSTTAAQRRATRRDASTTISRLLDS